MVISITEYVEKNLGQWILLDSEFSGQYEVISCSVKPCNDLNGFMAIILMCDVNLQRKADQRSRTVPIVVKVMKGTRKFRDGSKSFIQCSNEVFIYDTVIPYLKQFVRERNSSIEPDKWTPKIYRSFYGKIPELSEIDECLLVMENVTVSGFKNGPRKKLDLDHLTLMTKTIAQYHSVQYAMRIEGDEMLETMRTGLKSLRWKEPIGSTNHLYEILYKPAFQRMFDYLDRNPDMFTSEQMTEEVGLLRERFGKDPVSFLELFRLDDKPFSVIQHGDYNRNNVLFKYSPENPTQPIDLRMIDFQEVRYGSPAFDLFFYLYMSTTAEFREKHWDDLLQLYHGQIWEHLKELLNCQDTDERLKQYSYENFQKHFARFAFYGALVTIHFLPWMDSSPEEIDPLSQEFTNDMTSEKCNKMLLTVGGDVANKKVAQALQHAVSRGYLSFIKDV